MRLLPWLSFTFTVAALYGCAVPSTKYTLYSQGGEREKISKTADTYMLAKTQLTISRRNNDAGGEETSAIEVLLRKIEDPNYSFGITPWNRWYGVKTQIALTKVENTQLVQSLSVSVEDKRTEFIESAFKLLGTIAQIPISQKGEAEEKSKLKKFPAVVDASQIIKSCQRTACERELLKTSEWGVSASISVAEVPPDAIDIKHVSAPGFLLEASGVFFASACRQATIRISGIENSESDLVQHFSLADPNYVQAIALPNSGTITAHSECGYSVVPQNVELKPDTDVADKFFEELFKFRKAYRERDENSVYAEEDN
jgi:hypothetical protein